MRWLRNKSSKALKYRRESFVRSHQLNKDEPIFFAHIPKTGGTSFRKAAELYFGSESVCYDYGNNAYETTNIVTKTMISKPDPWLFKKAFQGKSCRFMAGHVHALRYSQIFGIDHSVTFFREPKDRIVSEYYHFVRHNHYQKSFSDFYKEERFINRQSKTFVGIPWAAMGFIGITENYDESLVYFNNRFDVKFPKLEENLNAESVKEDYELVSDIERELLELNKEDIQLYAQACCQFEWRVKLADEGKIFTRGMIGGYNNSQLKGWAVYDEGDDPVQVVVLVNGKSVGIATACEARPQLQALGIRRGGFVGFSIEIPKVEIGDEVTAFVTDTGQPLANSPWVYSGL